MRGFDDFAIGDRVRMGPVRVSHLEALEFARRYDPQPFLLSDAGAEGSPIFERMAVSGWLVSALMNRLIVEDMLANPVKLVGMPGVERLHWTRPVYPGDELMLEAEVVAARRLASRPTIGLVRQQIRTRNQDRKVVLTAMLALMVAAPERLVVMHRMVDA
ncbi:MAG: MaoC/PaaZ C-terminal domain-containing protein [Sphingomonadaceae bacterium]